MRSISKIKPSLRNARKHSPKQIRQIANSIVAFGFTNPLLVSEDDELIAGHGRYEAAKLLGLAEVPVIVVTGLSRVRRRALGIADNKIAQNSRWDRERLAIEIPELADSLPAEGLDISIIGFETVEIDHIVETDFEEHPAAPQDRIDSEWCKSLAVSKRGDLWQLGNHRLLCGDAHSIPDIARLMASCQADVAFIDPPANEQTAVDFVNLLSATFSAAASVSREEAVHYVCADWRRFAELLVAAKPIYGEPNPKWLPALSMAANISSLAYFASGTYNIAIAILNRPHLSSRVRTSGVTQKLPQSASTPPRSRSRSSLMPSRIARRRATLSSIPFLAWAPPSWPQSGADDMPARWKLIPGSSISPSVAGRPLPTNTRATPKVD
jgi:hypothetical protein